MEMCSSIFNFEPLKHALLLPLRTHVWHAFLVASAGCIIALGVMSLSASKEEFRHRIPTAAQLDQAEILMLGDSKLGGLSEETIAIPTVNLAYGGTAYRTQAALFKYYQPRMPRLRTLLVDFDNLPFRNPDLERRNGDFSDLTNLGLPWYLLPIPWHESITFAISYRSFLKPLLVRRQSPMDWLEGLVCSSGSSVAAGDQPSNQRVDSHEVENVFRVAKGFQFAPVAGAAKMRDYRQMYQDEAIYQANSRAFAEMLEIAELNHISVVLLRVPSTPAFGIARGEAWNRELQTILSESRKRFPSLQMSLWVVENFTLFPLEAFHDPNHLNPSGYRNYAEYLNHRLLQRPLPDDTGKFLVGGDPNWKVTKDYREDAGR